MIETERLYYQDVYTREFDAEVLECRPGKKGWLVLLNRSAFYPEGGGQPSDVGFLNEIKVTEVHEKEGELLHYTEEALEAGTIVHGRIDWNRRFDLMQQHSGEHMVSGLIHAAYGYENVGFHMGSEVITIDLSGPLDMSQLEEIERQVNREIWKNSAVEITYPSPDELKVISYRSKKELTGQVRIVTFPGVDICACCGTHVAYTGEIGMVKLLSVVKFHDGVRIEMICGNRVLQYLNQVDSLNRRISVKLSARPDRTAEAVEHLWEEVGRLKRTIRSLEDEMFQKEAEMYKGEGNVLLFREGLEADSVRRLADMVMQFCGGRCAVFSEAQDGTFKYAIGEKDGDLRSFTKEMNTMLNGRGGGKPFFVQGFVTAKEAEIRDFFKHR